MLDGLRGKKVLLTGGSGFVGKAVLAALLRDEGGPDETVLLLRAPTEAAARQRLLDEVLESDAFDAGAAEAVRRGLGTGAFQVLHGDLSDDGFDDASGDGWRDVDTVIHCAATVSFEEPLDDALALNTFGPARLLGRLRAGGSRPHFVHVSTAYVTNRKAGEISENGLPHGELSGLDPEAMLAQAREWRTAATEKSTGDSRSQQFRKAAERDAAQREGMEAGERAEALRSAWVQARLSQQGRKHAQAMGWPDTYALSKALGERLLAEQSERTTIIRPTIIESALRYPYPGWLEGIKVADPLILAYAARGLTHLPGRPGNRIDIVPVDHVANACLVAAAIPPDEAKRVLAIASSARNPLTIGGLAKQIKRYFRKEPLEGRKGSPIKIGDLRFVDREIAVRKAARRERFADVAARTAMASPIGLPQERLLRSNRAMAERVTRMVKIYGAYTELDVVFDDRNAQHLARELLPGNDELAFDTAAIDWDEYLQEIHLPQVRRLAMEA